MLYKFKDSGENTALPNEVRDIMQQYADFEHQYRINFGPINTLIAKITLARLKQRNSDPQLIDTESEINAGLELDFSAFTIAARGLESSLLAVKDWRITWRNYVRGEVIGEQISTDGDFTLVNLVRAPAEYEEGAGWINDANTGYNGVLNMITPLVQIKFEPDHNNGIYMSLSEMFEIELTQPGRES